MQDIIYCSQTQATQSHRIFNKDLNQHKTLFGGQLLAWCDEVTSLSASLCTQSSHIVTGTVDTLQFLHPIYEDHQLTLTSFVSGIGRKSMEVFIKAIGTDFNTQHSYLAATGFFIYIYQNDTPIGKQLIPNTQEEILICQEYAQRNALRTQKRGTLELQHVLLNKTYKKG